MKKRESWSNKFSFIFSLLASAVGLSNIIRFPYLFGEYGGLYFLLIYLLCIFLISYPIFVIEILIGKTTRKNPCCSFSLLGKNFFWKFIGFFVIFVSFLVSIFYSIISSWVLGYLLNYFFNDLSIFNSLFISKIYFINFIKSYFLIILLNFIFILICCFILYFDIKKGLEKINKLLIPLIFLLLLYLVYVGYKISHKSIFMIFNEFSFFSYEIFFVALGQAFFTLSAGQGTMIVYGSYLNNKIEVLKSSLIVVFGDLFVSLLSVFSILLIIYSVEIKPDYGIGLMFLTIPYVFSNIVGGSLIYIVFFSLLFLAALTSQISVIEPLISYFVDVNFLSRKYAAFYVSLIIFLSSIPFILTFSFFKDYICYGYNIFNLYEFLVTSCFIPICGLFVVILSSWKNNLLLFFKEEINLSKNYFLFIYFKITIKYLSPIIILMIIFIKFWML